MPPEYSNQLRPRGETAIVGFSSDQKRLGDRVLYLQRSPLNRKFNN